MLWLLPPGSSRVGVSGLSRGGATSGSQDQVFHVSYRVQLAGILSLLPGPVLLAALISVLIWGSLSSALVFALRTGVPLVVLAVVLLR